MFVIVSAEEFDIYLKELTMCYLVLISNGVEG